MSIIIPMNNSLSSTRYGSEICLRSYTDLLRTRTMEILYNGSKELTANVHTLDMEGRVVHTIRNLPVEYKSKEWDSLKNDVQHLHRFLSHTHLIPERGANGLYDRVSIHPSLKGGLRGKIPFVPGIALGSLIHGKIFDELKKAREKAREEILLEKRSAAMQEILSLDIQIEGLNDTDSGFKAFLENKKEIIKREINSLENQLGFPPIALQDNQGAQQNNEQAIQINNAQAVQTAREVAIFDNSQDSLESPLDKAYTIPKDAIRSFESLTFSSKYIKIGTSTSGIHELITQESNATNISASAGGWSFMPSGNASFSWTKSVSDRVSQIMKEKTVQGVLLINSMVATRYVRCLPQLKFDKSKLKSIISIMENGTKKQCEDCGIVVNDKVDNKGNIEKDRALYIFTEAVLGGSFTALVTFQDEERNERNVTSHLQEKSKEISLGVKAGGIFSDSSLGGGRSSRGVKQSGSDVLDGMTSTRVNFELVSQGAIPSFTHKKVAHDVIEHLNVLNPSNFGLSKEDEEDAKLLVSSSNSQEKMAALQRRKMRIENAQAAVINTIKTLTKTSDEQNILTPESAIEAHDSFTSKIASDPGCGIPLGYNYQIFSLDSLKEELKQLEKSANAGNFEELKHKEEKEKV